MASFDLSKANPNVPAHLRGPSPTEGYITGMSTALAVQLTVATAPDSTGTVCTSTKQRLASPARVRVGLLLPLRVH